MARLLLAAGALALSIAGAAQNIVVNTEAIDLSGSFSFDGGDVSSVAALIATPGTNGLGLDEALAAIGNDSGAGPFNITFTSNVITISLFEDLPTITKTVNIDGGGNVTIECNADNSMPALYFTGGEFGSVEGLTIIDSGNAGIGFSGTANGYSVYNCNIYTSNSHDLIQGPDSWSQHFRLQDRNRRRCGPGQ